MKEIAPGITVDRGVRFGKPIIRGTRVPADLIIKKLAGGMTIEKVMEEYSLRREDVMNALSYAAKLISEEEVRAAERFIF